MTNGIRKGLAFIGAVACALIIFIGMTTLGATDPTLLDFEAIEIGAKQANIYEKFGEPTGTLSGMYGDIYEVDGKKVVIYYGFSSDDSFPVTEVKISDAKEVAEAIKPTLSDFEAIEIGTKQADIHEKFGEPVGTLSGLYGDIFEVEDKRIILYYGFNPDGGFPMTEVKIVDKK